VAGALLASLVEFIEPGPFNVGASIMMYLMVVVGGAGYFFGPLLGAAVGVLLPEWLRFAQGYYLMGYAALVMLLMIFSPTGILGFVDRIFAAKPKDGRAPSAMPNAMPQKAAE
jgi:branched-chain amino acid transport system permease protein